MVIVMVGCTPVALEPVDNHLSADFAATPTSWIETHVNADWTNVQSRTEDGLAMLGNPNAPVTFIDYSDFM